jgi:hypothetical protein
MVDTVNIGQAPEDTQTVSIGPSTPPVDVDTARLRAEKAQFGLGSYMPNMNKDSWYSGILSGQEPEMRQSAAAAVKLQDTNNRLATLGQTGQLPPPKNADPQSIIEQEFANKFMSPMKDMSNEFYGTSLYGQANIQNAAAVDQVSADAAHASTMWDVAKTWGTAYAQSFQGASQDIASQILHPTPYATAPFSIANDIVSAILGAPIEATGETIEKYFPSLKKAQEQGQILPLESVANVIGTGLFIMGFGTKATGKYVTTADSTTLPEMKMETQSKLDKIRAVANDTRADPATRAVAQSILDRMEGRPTGPVQQAADEAVKASTTVDNTRPAEAVQASTHGDLEKAAEVQTAANIDAGTNPLSEQQRDLQSLTSNYRIDMDLVKTDPTIERGSFYGQDLTNRIQDANDSSVAGFTEKIATVQKVNRTPYAIAQSDVVREEMDRIRGNYRGWGNAILNIEFDPVADYNNVTGTYTTRSYAGTYDGTLFKDKETAELQAPLMGVHLKTDPNDVGAIVVNKGSGWAIQLRTPFVENSEALLGNSETGLASTKDTRTPRSWLDSLAKGWVSSPGMSMSKTEMQNRIVTAMTPSEIKETALGDWKIINDIDKDNWGKFNQLLEYGRDLYDKDGNKGYFFESPGEIEDWHTLFWPNAGMSNISDMIEGYFAYKRLYNMDLALRNISAYQFAARLGTEQHQFSVKDSNSGQPIKSDWVKAIRRNTLPAGNDPVLILGDTKGVDDDLVSAKKLGTTKRGQQIKEDIETGKASVFEMYDTSLDDHGLSDVSYKARNKKVRYVINYGKSETKPLDVGQMIPRRGGGHFDYKFQGAAVQPKFRYDSTTDTWIYDGDRIITMHDNPGEGKDFAWRMNTVRKYMVEGMHDVGQATAKSLLHMGPDRFNAWFKEMRTPQGGRVPPYLDYDSPIVYIHRGEASIKHPVIANLVEDRFGKKFRDGTTSGSAAAQFKVQYTGERDSEDLFTARNKGTWNNPLWEYEPTKMIDPLPVLGRAVNRISNSQASDPMKIASITHWLKEAYPLMKPRTQKEVWAAPWRIFNSAEIDWNKTTENLPAIRAMEGTRRKIKSFSGAFNPEERFMYSVTSKLAESLYEGKVRVGHLYVNPKASVVASWMLPAMSDPWTIARSIAVHPILGLFKLSALPMQLTTFTNVLGIAGPRHAGAGFVAALMHEFTRVNAHPEFLKLLDTFAQAFGWKRGELMEAYEGIHTTGFWNVAGEHGLVDTNNYNPIKSVAQSILNAGMKPFQEGAQFVRYAAWYTAWHEYRRGGGGLTNFEGTPLEFKKNAKGEYELDQSSGMPIKNEVIRREDMAKILYRASILDHGMNRAHTADYQKGPGSIPFNFWAYKLRLTEFMLGFGRNRQLTNAEKLRLFGVTTMMFGPLYGPLGLLGVGLDEYIRRSMLSGNWDINIPFTNINIAHPGHTNKFITGDNWWLSTFIHGLPAGMLAWYTSNPKSKDPARRRGNWYDFDEHFGNPGLLEDMVRDRTIMTMVAGAPGSKFAEAFAKASPLAYDFWNWAANGNKGTTVNDLIEAARVINGFNSLYVPLTAAGTHTVMTKSNSLLQTNVSTKNAWFMSTMGVQDLQTIDAFDRSRVMRIQDAARDDADKQATKELHFMFDALRNHDPDAAQAHQVKAYSYLAVVQHPALEDPKKMVSFYERAVQSYTQSIPSQINKKFFSLTRYPTGGLSDIQIVEDHLRAEQQGLIEPDKDTGTTIKAKRRRR